MKKLLKNIKNIYAKYKNYKNRYFDSKENLVYVYRKKQGLVNHAAQIETIAIRGSNTDYAFLPQYIDNSYNLGLTSSDVYFNYHLYLKCKEILSNLKNVIYFMNGFANGMSLIRIKEKYRLVSYKYFFGIPYQEEGFIDEKIEKKIIKKCKKIKVNMPDNYCGYETKKFFMIGTNAGVRAQNILKDNRREPDQIIWIKKTIEQIIEDDKHIFIVIPPYSTKLKNNLPPKEELYKKTYSLLNNYGNSPNIHLIDLYDSDLFDDSDMGDNDHFNEKGAKKCTMIIKDYLDCLMSKNDNRSIYNI
ncbi:MAG: hypothetical protein LBR97_07560 [Dysgonamonadaceae bacterium]|jgi:hypothetical protein|nr:hypothetical protein [Dysgonamonadaceae bacterium]